MPVAEIDLAELVGDGVRAAEQWLAQLSVGDWVLLALAGGALSWIILGLLALTRLGPIEIKSLEEESEAKQPIKGLTAVVARRIHSCGLISPSEVPAGAPQADLISAVEASPVPQASWIASILKAMPRPRPPAYSLGGTVVKDATGTGPGIGYWVRPVREGREIQGFVEANGTDLEHAATCVADKAYLHIIEDAALLLPLWARWSVEEAFAAYMEGIEHLANNRDLRGASSLNKAAKLEATNLLIRLQFANLLERTVDTGAGGRHDDQRAIKYARALNAYLRVAKLEPTVVEARYRASILAAMLASCIVGRPRKYQNAIRRELTMITLPRGPKHGGPDQGQEAQKTLNELSRSESNAVLKMLRPWYTLLRHGRLRHQLELGGLDRKRLRNSVRISRHCVWLRERGEGLSRYNLARALWRWLVVRWLVLRGVGWHGHYNAACFDSLFHQRLEERYTA